MKNELKYIILSFLTWRMSLFVILYFAFTYISSQQNFLGGGMQNYLKNPYLWSWANFDGEHFLSIAQLGYQPLTHFFFPIYPLLVKLFSSLIATSLITYLYSGLFISNIGFLIGLIGFNKLIRLDYKFDISKLALLSLLFFPTSFYFAGVYSESIFFALCVWAFYFARKGNFLLAGILTSFATATRVVGITLLVPILYEFWINRDKNLNLKNIIGLLISPLGIIFYMIYLGRVTGDPLNFFNTVGIFGEQRSSGLIALPQVFYRYVFKVLPNLDFSYFPSIFTTLLEFVSASVFLVITIFSFKRLRLSYWVFMASGYLIPTFSGSFSSLPRYVLILFPAFIFISQFLINHRVLRFVFFVVSLATLVVSLMLFSRGYWVS